MLGASRPWPLPNLLNAAIKPGADQVPDADGWQSTGGPHPIHALAPRYAAEVGRISPPAPHYRREIQRHQGAPRW